MNTQDPTQQDKPLVLKTNLTSNAMLIVAHLINSGVL
jgi:hypothetical protein